MDTFNRALLLWLGALVIAVLTSSQAHAQSAGSVFPEGTVNVFRTASGAQLITAPNYTNLALQPGSPVAMTARTITADVASGVVKGVNVAEAYGFELGAGKIAVQVARKVPLLGLATAAYAVYTVGDAAFNDIGAPISKALGHDTLEIGDTKCTATYSMGWVCGEKQPAAGGGTLNGFMSGNVPATARATRQDSCDAWALLTHRPYGAAVLAGGSGCYPYANSSHTSVIDVQGVPISPTTFQGAQSCPASIDALNPAWSVPEGSPAGADGTCPTGRYTAASGAFIQGVMQANLAAKPGLPEQLAQATLNKGGTLPADSLSVSGPASLTGPSTTSTTSVQPVGGGATQTTTKVSTPTSTYSYAGNNISVNTTTTTTTTNNYDNSTTTTVEDKPDEGVPTDSALPALPTLYERKYPDGMVGIWNTNVAAIKASPLFSLAGSLMPSFGDSGTCPSWPINPTMLPGADYGTFDVAPPCWLWDFGAAVLLVSALLLARSLIFGG